MGYVRTVAPAIEPLTLAEAKLHLRVSASDEDSLIAMLIAAARQYAEAQTRQSLITQTWTYTFDGFFDHETLLLEKGPVQSVVWIKYQDMSGVLQTLPQDDYVSDFTGTLARIRPAFGKTWPITLPQIGSCAVCFAAGYGDTAADVPPGLRQWLLLRVGSLYANREDVLTDQGVSVQPLPFVDGLLDAYRVVCV